MTKMCEGIIKGRQVKQTRGDRIMNRLTERDEYGNADVIGVDSAEYQLSLCYEDFIKLTDALNRLAAYEDTGLEPEEVAERRVAYE